MRLFEGDFVKLSMLFFSAFGLFFAGSIATLGGKRPTPEWRAAQVEKRKKKKPTQGNVSETGELIITFDDVAGQTAAKDALEDIIDYLRDPRVYERMGARMPRGVLLVGPPGNGKTLLARAVAGETNCKFIAVVASQFEEVWVGLGAARIRELFKEAREVPNGCIIFIDEIDALGSRRDIFGGSSSQAQTLNQILTEMDGFTPGSKIMVIGATNRVEALDPALIRPGRFDRHVYVGNPGFEDRIEGLLIHARNKPLDADVDFDKLAQLTDGCSYAELENIMNEAALLAIKRRKNSISMSIIVDIIERLRG